jgi:hypothetical protein
MGDKMETESWAGRFYRLGKGERGTCRVLVGNLRERDHLEDVSVDKRILLK